MHELARLWSITASTTLSSAANTKLPESLADKAVHLLGYFKQPAVATFVHFSGKVPHIDFVKLLVATIPQLIEQGFQSFHLLVEGKPAIVGFGDVEGWDSIHKARRLRSHLRPIIKAVKDADILWTNQDYQAWANTPVGANLVEITLPAATDPVSVSDIVCLTGDLWPDRGILNVWGLFTTERLNAPYQAYGQHLSIHELDESPPTFLIMDMSFAVALCAAYKKGSADSIGEYIDRITSAQPDHLGFLAWVDDRLEPFIIDLKRSRIRHDPNALDEGHVAALRWLTGFLSGTSCTVWNIHASTFGIGDEFGLSALATLEEAFAISARVPIPHWTLSADAMRSYILALVVGGYIQGVALGKAGAVDKAVK